jgi:hypothetical protein
MIVKLISSLVSMICIYFLYLLPFISYPIFGQEESNNNNITLDIEKISQNLAKRYYILY